MKKLEIKLNDNIDFSDFKKIISFISEDIISYDYNQQTKELSLSLLDRSNEDDIRNKTMELSKKYLIKAQDDIYFENINQPMEYFDALSDDSKIFKFSDGVLGFSSEIVFLYKYFEKEFIAIAKSIGGEEKLYPVLLPVDSYKKTGYLNTSPQYSIFCFTGEENISKLEKLNDSLDSPDFYRLTKFSRLALSPSACFHVYAEYENKELPHEKIFTFTQDVFRNEGRFNYNEVGRLKSYHVREIVFIGSIEFVEEKRNQVIEQTRVLIKKLNLNGNISLANDPFILPIMQKYKKLQRLSKIKYETKLKINSSKSISVASFNLHGTAFTMPFNIKVANIDHPVSGCVGYGIERWVLAFLCQYGSNNKNWPDEIKEEYVLWTKLAK